MNGKRGVGKHQVIAVALAQTFYGYRVRTGSRRRGKLKMKHRVVFLVHFDAFYLGELLDAGLYLHGLRRFIAEPFDKSLGVGQHFLLVLVSAQLLFATLAAKRHIFVVLHLVIVNMSEFDLKGAVCGVVDKRAVVRDEDHRVG